MSQWMVKAARSCTGLLDLLRNEIRGGPLINIDESPFQVLKEPGRRNTTKSYMWVYRGGPPDQQV
jgi:transposase